MIRRLSYILNRFTLTDSGTYTIPFNLRDIITALWVEFRATNGDTSNQANLLADCISEIALIDGGNVIYSLTGAQALAEGAYRMGFMSPDLVVEPGALVQSFSVPMMFGRWFGDDIYAFDPSRFTNPQVRITWNLSAVATVAATAFATGTLTVTVFAEIMDGAPAPQAMITAKSLYSFTTVASGVQPILLPTDRRIKAILLRSFIASGGGLAGISNVKLQADNNKVVFADMRTTDLERYSFLRNKPFSYKHVFYAANGDTIYPILKYLESLHLTPHNLDTVAVYDNTGGGHGAVGLYTAGSAQTADQWLIATVFGYMPMGVHYMEHGEWDNPNTWLDPTPYKSVQLELTQSAASSAASVALEQEYIY